MQKRLRLTWWGLGISLGCHAAAVGMYLAAPDYESLPARFTAQFIAFASLSTAGSFVLAFGQSAVSKGAVVLFKIVVLCVLTFPLEEANAVPVLLGTPIVVELVFRIHRPLGIWLGLAFVLAFGLVRVVSLGWASGSSLDQGMELVVFPVLLLTVIGALADVARRYRTLLAEQGEHIERLDSAVQELSEANLGFQRYADFVAERSTADERNRITREVHDTTIYALTNLKMMLEAAGYMAQGESKKLKALLKNAYTQAREGIENTRSALRALRTINTRGIGNYKAIQRIAEAYQAATGVTVEIQYGNLPRETLPEIDRFMYRFVQEGMTNAFRHGRATHILLLFWIDNDTLTISLHDNGRGAPSLNEGIGLRGMRERISELEGELKVQNVQSGFKLIARIPYPRASETGASKTGASKESTSETGAAENQEPGEPQEVSYDADRTGRRPDAVRG